MMVTIMILIYYLMIKKMIYIYHIRSKLDSTPSMCLTFELYQLANGSSIKRDTIVGWGAFPLVYNNLDLIKGKFKCPILRGSMHNTYPIDRYDTIQYNISKNLDSWLCNMYFEVDTTLSYIDHQPRYRLAIYKTKKDLENDQSSLLEQGKSLQHDQQQVLKQQSEEEILEGKILNLEPEKQEKEEEEEGPEERSEDEAEYEEKSLLRNRFEKKKKKKKFHDNNHDGNYYVSKEMLPSLGLFKETLVNDLHQQIQINKKKVINKDVLKFDTELYHNATPMLKEQILKQYSYSLTNSIQQQKKHKKLALYREKLNYIFNELSAEIGFNKWQTLNFGLSIYYY